MTSRPRTFPDFLCIGAQKAGTTWLHENLSLQPQIWLPPVKEIHFLDHPSPSLAKRLFGKPSHHRLAREHFRQTAKDWLACKSGPEELSLAALIAFGRRDWDWYQRMFDAAGSRVSGEICPGYARMEEDAIGKLARKRPDLKIIYLLRDPVDRAWSSLAMHFRKNDGELISDISPEDVLERLRYAKTFAHCAYDRNISAWRRHFPDDQFYFGFFDRIRAEPEKLLADILAFLGVSSAVASRQASAPVNSGKGERMPAAIEHSIAALLLPEAEKLQERFHNGFTSKWLEHARSAAAR